jgi:hypothetical protein
MASRTPGIRRTPAIPAAGPVYPPWNGLSLFDDWLLKVTPLWFQWLEWIAVVATIRLVAVRTHSGTADVITWLSIAMLGMYYRALVVKGLAGWMFLTPLTQFVALVLGYLIAFAAWLGAYQLAEWVASVL